MSPDESPTERRKGPEPTKDGGASPNLRRSSRKRKSISVVNGMSKNSASKKKKNSPDPGRSMPKIPRTPQGSRQEEGAEPGQPSELETLLAAMEGRLAAKIEKASEAAKEAVAVAKMTNDGLGNLELRVEEVQAEVGDRIKESEERIMKAVEEKVKGMVDDQLRAAGFDQDLTAADLTLRSSVQQNVSSYAGMLSKPAAVNASRMTGDKEDRREARFWKARRALRLWPVEQANREGVARFLTDKLRMDRDFVKEETSNIEVSKVRDHRSKLKDEVIVHFESKQIRDAVRAKAANLANFGQEVGMRLELPDHLQKDFRLLMNLAYDLKKKNPDLKRNIKFDEDDLGLYMDVQMERDGPWRRIKPDPVKQLSRTRRSARGPDMIEADELRSLVDSEDEEAEA